MIRVEHADMLTVIPALVAEGVVVDAVVTDPPYGLGFMGVAWDTINGRSTGSTARRTKDKWDGTGTVHSPETWATVASIMRPGAFLVAFGGTRTHHRVWCAIEDAGFVIQDTIMWLFGSGFPKQRYMLKPAFEPICLAYKPGGKRTMQIEECRIGSGDNTTKTIATDLGRWPANICHDGSDEVLAAFPESNSRRSIITSRPGTFYGGSHTDIYGFDDSGSAARFFFSAKAGAEDRWGSRHPTVKPVDLIAWLVKLVCPPGGTFLDPFAGSGTAAVAALATGRNAILIEREPQYIADIRERVAFYEGGGMHSAQAKHRKRKAAEHGPLFDRPYGAEADAIGSYYDAIAAIGERVKAGEPVPTTGYFGSDKLEDQHEEPVPKPR